MGADGTPKGPDDTPDDEQAEVAETSEDGPDEPAATSAGEPARTPKRAGDPPNKDSPIPYEHVPWKETQGSRTMTRTGLQARIARQKERANSQDDPEAAAAARNWLGAIERTSSRVMSQAMLEARIARLLKRAESDDEKTAAAARSALSKLRTLQQVRSRAEKRDRRT